LQCHFYGTRGSAPNLKATHQQLGGETSCVAVVTPSSRVLLDAGTGLTRADTSTDDDVVILSHFHIDHMLGLADFAARKRSGRLIISSALCDSPDELERVVGRIYGPPAYPVSIRQIYPSVEFLPLTALTAELPEGVEVAPIELNHPGGSVGTRVTEKDTGKTVVYVSDHEHGSHKDEPLLEFCADVDMVIWDSSYDDATFTKYKGWGHSTWQEGLRFAQACGARAIALTHHDATRDDVEAEKIEKLLDGSIGFLAKDGMVVEV